MPQELNNNFPPSPQHPGLDLDTLSRLEKEIWRRIVDEYSIDPKDLGYAPENDTQATQARRLEDDLSSFCSVRGFDPLPGFINLVTSRRWIEPRCLYRLRYKLMDKEPKYGFCVNLADVQRMYLRLLQGRLTWLALSAGFDADNGVSQGVLTELGPMLREYGGFLCSRRGQSRRIQCRVYGVAPQYTDGTHLTSTSPSRPRLYGAVQWPNP
jgi:hypothetical protein